MLDKNPFIHISKPKKKRGADEEEIYPFSADEVAILLDKAPQPLRNFLAISFYTGMRSGEALGLQISDIKSDTIEVKRSISKNIISSTKTEKTRTLPLFDVLKPYIEDQIIIARQNKSIWLFSKEDGKHLYGIDNIMGHTPYDPWYKLLKETGMGYRKIYNTRHTFITAMLKSGQLSVLEIAHIVGHSNSKMILERYAKHIKGEHLKISKSFDPFKNDVTNRGDSRGDTINN